MSPTHRFPVSVKGVVLAGSRVVLLENERDEWELPGGKLEPGESPETCVAREIHEELGLRVAPGPLLDVWVYRVRAGDEDRDVLIVTYGCQAEPFEEIVPSAEHRAARLFDLAEVPGLRMPDGYKRSVRTWAERASGRGRIGACLQAMGDSV